MGKPHARARPIVGSGGAKTPHGIAFYCMLLCLLYKKLYGIWEYCVFFVLYLLGYSLVLYGFVCMELVLQGIGRSCVRKGGGTKYFTKDCTKYFT